MTITETSAAEPSGLEPTDPVSAFIEQMGLIYEKENMPRIGGRLLALLLVEDRAFSLRELADRLQVSRASVSTNTRMLADIGIIVRVGKPGDRQDYYRLAPHPLQSLVTGIVQRMRMMEEFLRTSALGFPTDRAGAKARLLELADFYRATTKAMAGLAQSFAVSPTAPSKIPQD